MCFICSAHRKYTPQKAIGVIFITLVFALFYIIESQAAIIHLKNKGKIEGVVKSESEGLIVVDMGFGTVTISKDDIEFIEHKAQETSAAIEGVGMKSGVVGASGELWKDTADLSRQLRNVKKKKIKAIKYKSRHDRLKYKLVNLEREISFSNSKFENLNNRLRRAKKDDVYAYNKLVAELNSVSARMQKMTNDFKQTRSLKEKLDPDVSKYVSEYNKALHSLETEFSTVYAKVKKNGFSNKDKENFYESLKDEIYNLKRDFIRREVKYVKRGNQVIVEVLLNNRVKASLMLDTGASCVLISRDVADRLGVKEGFGTGKGTFVVADGRKIVATTFVLRSVTVGDSTSNNVQAAISGESQGSGIDGLLGMSFLSNFIFRIDTKGNKLILEKFRH